MTTLLKIADVCELLKTTRTGIRNLELRDSSFPKKIKLYDSQQSPAYYDLDEINQWFEAKKAARTTAANDSSFGGV